MKAVISEADHFPNHTAAPLTGSVIVIAGRSEVIDSVAEVYTKPINVSEITDEARVTAALDLPAGIQSFDGITEVMILVKIQR